MLKKRLPELALGALLATVLWTIVLGWQASYAPTEREKQECYEAAKKTGHKTEDCQTFWERATSDPIAVFTLVLALSTVGLWVSTIALYLAGREQSRLARDEFISTHRPIIRIRRVCLSAFAARFGADNISHGDEVEIELTISNAGSSTANITDSRYRIYFFKTEKPQNDAIFGESVHKITDEKMTLAVGERRRMFVTGTAIMEAPPPGERIMRQFATEGWHMHIIGEITYEDGMERKRHTGFLREWEPGGAFRRVNDPDYEYED